MTVNHHNGAIAGERENYAFDASVLERWLTKHVEGFAGPLAITRFSGGQSNPTYRLDTPGRGYVLRRKPPGHLLPGAHAVDREYRAISALHALGFPVAAPYALCLDDAVIGTAFYVMELVEGRIFWDPALPDVSREERPACFDAMNATIARLHGIDPVAAGLGDFGKAGNYFERQIARWTRQYLGDEAAGRVPAMDRLAEWLPANIPPGEDATSIIHGDFRCDNMVFHRSEPRVIAVLDWELSTLGNPVADFTYHLMMYRLPRGLVAGLGGCDLAALNIPPEADYVRAYCRRTGRDGIPGLDFYLAFNMFRIAAIIHGIKGRLLRGNAASARADKAVADLDALAKLGWEQAKRTGAS